MTPDPRRLVLAVLHAADPEAAREAGLRAIRRHGVGGFLLFGGRSGPVRELLDRLREAADHPLLVASDLERGAGQQLADLPRLPWAMAFGAADDPDLTRRAGRLTAVGARRAGVDLVLAPVADVSRNPRNPIVDIRAYGDDPEGVSRHAAAFCRGVAAGGRAACAKHFPGHGATAADSHATLPAVADDAETVRRLDLPPFRAAVEAGVSAVMTAHLRVPSLGIDGPASRNPATTRLLRDELEFEGVVLTDALLMEGAGDEASSARRALEAGADLLLAPADPGTAGPALEGTDPGRVREAIGRVEALLDDLGAPPGDGPADDASLGSEVLSRAVCLLRGEELLPVEADPVVLAVGAADPGDDDGARAILGPEAPVDAVTEALSAGTGPLVVEVVTAPRAWADPPRLPPSRRRALRLAAARRALVLVSRGSPRVLARVPEAAAAVCVPDPGPEARRAVRRALAAGGPFPGSLPVHLAAGEEGSP